ncbi:MAG TPA: cytochrome c3 family protein [Candidatus Latescibacteria bacterium]|nr:cytochrome c3 family protein [Candidatus Latescibacterota bacterium]
MSGIAFVLLLLGSAQADTILSRGSSNEWCWRCHGMATFSVLRADGTIRTLSADSTAFLASNHRRLRCVTCHSWEDVQVFPHGKNAHMAQTCTDCHVAESHPLNRTDPLQAMHFREITDEFRKSVHYQTEDHAFSCFSCHDPHRFRKSENPSLQTIGTQNGVCLGCHGDAARFATLSERRIDLSATHAWLPRRELHWEHVRCLDCHTSYAPPNLSHNILPADSAVHACEQCHRQNSILLDKLYRYRHVEERSRNGFVNAALVNDSYVIGSTRNRYLDLLGAVLVGGACVGVAGHGFGRWHSAGKKRK